MRTRALLLAGLLTGAAPAAHAQPGYGQGGYGASGYDQPGYGQGDRAQGGSAYDRGYDDRSGPQGQQGQGQDRGQPGRDGYDDDRAPAPGAVAGRSPAGASYADADQAPPDLGRELRLRPEQQSALRAYQQATTPSQADQQRAQQDFQRLGSLTTPQRLDFTAGQMQRDQADYARRAVAVRRFYAQLTPEQQRRFDQITAPPQDGEGDQGGAPQR